MSINQLNGFACAVSSPPGAIGYQQRAGMYVHGQCAGKEGSEGISKLHGISNVILMQK